METVGGGTEFRGVKGLGVRYGTAVGRVVRSENF